MKVVTLDKELATAELDRIIELLDRIPLVTHSTGDVLGEEKRGFALVDKWALSLAAVEGEVIVGVLLSYFRPVELPQYEVETCYLAELAVDEAFEGNGIGSALVREWLRRCEPYGVPCSLQTNGAPFNSPVLKFYERFGFQTASTKPYDNRTDVVMLRQR